MIILNAKFAKYEIFRMPLISFELSFGHSYEHFKTKNVVDSTLFPNIVSEIQCIDCENDHFECKICKI